MGTAHPLWLPGACPFEMETEPGRGIQTRNPAPVSDIDPLSSQKDPAPLVPTAAEITRQGKKTEKEKSSVWERDGQGLRRHTSVGRVFKP